MFTFSVAIPIFSKKERLPSSRFSASSLIGAAQTTPDFSTDLLTVLWIVGTWAVINALSINSESS